MIFLCIQYNTVYLGVRIESTVICGFHLIITDIIIIGYIYINKNYETEHCCSAAVFTCTYKSNLLLPTYLAICGIQREAIMRDIFFRVTGWKRSVVTQCYNTPFPLSNFSPPLIARSTCLVAELKPDRTHNLCPCATGLK